MFVVDTNILIYAANRDAQEHTCCNELIQEWRRQAPPWYIT
jgi:predicted nucleic acid-binding protein